MKPIFNSLGSNYNFWYSIHAFSSLFLAQNNSLNKLKQRLFEYFKGDVYLFYKGRDAIEFSLRSLNIGKGDCVLTQAFTCWAIEEGIKRSGANPGFVDIEKNKLNPSLKTLDQAFHRNKNVKALIIQHTLGFPANIDEIRKWCNQKNIYLIEDLAQAFGARDKTNQLLGSTADVVIYSFGRDKVVDATSGGACLFRCKIKNKDIEIQENLGFQVLFKDLLYPLLTWFIRDTYLLGIGKLLHLILTAINFFTSPILSPTSKITKLQPAYADLTLRQLKILDKQLKHRRKISNYYHKNFKKKALVTKEQLQKASNLRFPVYVENPGKVLAYLKKRYIYLEDRWYRKPVDTGKGSLKSSYQKGSCKNAKSLAKKIINLPTHQEIDLNDARRIVKELKYATS